MALVLHLDRNTKCSTSENCFSILGICNAARYFFSLDDAQMETIGKSFLIEFSIGGSMGRFRTKSPQKFLATRVFGIKQIQQM